MNNLLLLTLLVTNALSAYQVVSQREFNREVMEFQDKVATRLTNTIEKDGVRFQVYGLEGKGFVRQAYEVYTPVYMAESTIDRLKMEVEAEARVRRSA